MSYVEIFSSAGNRKEYCRANPVHFHGSLEEFLYYIIHWGGSFCSFTAGYICECSFVKYTVIYLMYLVILFIAKKVPLTLENFIFICDLST